LGYEEDIEDSQAGFKVNAEEVSVDWRIFAETNLR
jgi:hypothetical protein